MAVGREIKVGNHKFSEFPKTFFCMLRDNNMSKARSQSVHPKDHFRSPKKIVQQQIMVSGFVLAGDYMLKIIKKDLTLKILGLKTIVLSNELFFALLKIIVRSFSI